MWNRIITTLFTLAALALTGPAAWGDNNVNLVSDGNGGWYRNLPTEGTDRLTITTDDLAAGKGTFKVYDDGGKDGNHSTSCQGSLVIIVPDGYMVQVSGTVWTSGVVEGTFNTTFLHVYDGDYSSFVPLLATVISSSDGEATDFGPVYTTSNVVSLFFQVLGGSPYQGLDLTVTVLENTLYNISVAEGIVHGSVTPSANSARFNNTITLTVTPDQGYYIGTVKYHDGSDHVITPNDYGVYSFTMPKHDVTVSATFLDDVGHLWGEGNDGSAEHPYVISNKAGWDLLVTKTTTDNNNITRDKYFELRADINGVTQSVLFFGGHLDGKGHKITLTMNESNHGYGLIWRISDNCSFNNLTVDGSIANQEQYVGGFIAQASLPATFTNCRSSVAITSSYAGDDFKGGGFVGFTGGHYITVDRCVFDGSFISSNNLTFSPWVGGIHYHVTNSAYLYGGVARFYNGAGYSDIPAHHLTLTNPAVAVRTGGTAIGNDAGTVYTDGFTLDGAEYFRPGASVIFGVPGLVVTSAQYQFQNSANLDATINTEGKASFTMPSYPATATITGFEAHYIDADGTEQTHAVSLLSSSEETVTKPGGWYVVIGDVTLNKGLEFSDVAHLILADGASLSVIHNNTDACNNIAILATDLNIYGQTLGTGTLDVSSYNNDGSSSYPTGAYGIKATGSITLCGGLVNASASGPENTSNLHCYAIFANKVRVIRGYLSAASFHYNITASDGILLDWRLPTDRICLTMPSLSMSFPSFSTVSVAEGKALWNGTEVLSGALGIIQFNGITLIPYTNAGETTRTLTAHQATFAGQTRYWTTFYHPYWNFLLPPGAQAFIMKSDHALYRIGDGSLIPADCAVVIMAESASIEVTATTADAPSVDGNILQGTSAATAASTLVTGNQKVHVMGLVSNTFGFFEYSGEIPAHKAFYVK